MTSQKARDPSVLGNKLHLSPILGQITLQHWTVYLGSLLPWTTIPGPQQHSLAKGSACGLAGVQPTLAQGK